MFSKIKLTTKLLCFITPIMIVVMGILFIWLIKREEHFIRKEIKEETKILAQQLKIIRGYIAEKQDIINTDPETGNVVFKHLNPAVVGTAFSKRVSLSTKYIMKQTSLKYRNPDNAPDEYETKILKQFQTKKIKDEIWGEDYDEEGNKTIRYMIPLYIKKDCLQCHGKPAYEGELDITGHKKEGYELGDLRGAISVIAPAGQMVAAIKTNSLILLIVGIISTISTIFLTYLLIRRFVKKPLSRIVAATNAIAGGDLSKRVDIKSGDEFGELAESFNTMVEYTEEKTRDLEEALRSEKLMYNKLDIATEKLLLKSQYQEAIEKISRLLCMDLDLQRIMDNVVNVFSKLLGVKFCGIFLLDKSKYGFSLKSGIGWSEDVIGRVAFAGLNSHADYTLIEGIPVVVRDMRTETRFSGASFFNDLEIISGVCVPMVAGGHVLGVIAVYTERARQFSKDEVDTLQSVGQLTAEVIVLKHGEEEINKLSCATKQSPSMVLITDTKGRIEYANPSFSRITGYTSEEIVGKNLRLLESDKTNPEKYKEIWESFTSGREWQGELHNRKKNGELILESVSITPIRNAEGMITNFLKVSEDITERKKREEELTISQKMASLGRLTAGVFHEVLNPLNIISSYAQLLLSQGKWSSKTEGDLKKILEEVDRIVKITDGLLRFARKKELKIEKVKINSLLKKIIDIVEPEMKLENIELLRKFDEGLPKVIANSDELRQVFLNLIHNAVYAMPDGGKLTISTQSIKNKGKLFVRISFTDTGCGIPKKYFDKIFDPFFSTKKEGEGTGLGLSISYGIIDSHGGNLSVDSEEGKGATFTVDLPAKD